MLKSKRQLRESPVAPIFIFQERLKAWKPDSLKREDGGCSSDLKGTNQYVCRRRIPTGRQIKPFSSSLWRAPIQPLNPYASSTHLVDSVLGWVLSNKALLLFLPRYRWLLICKTSCTPFWLLFAFRPQLLPCNPSAHMLPAVIHLLGNQKKASRRNRFVVRCFWLGLTLQLWDLSLYLSHLSHLAGILARADPSTEGQEKQHTAIQLTEPRRQPESGRKNHAMDRDWQRKAFMKLWQFLWQRPHSLDVHVVSWATSSSDCILRLYTFEAKLVCFPTDGDGESCAKYRFPRCLRTLSCSPFPNESLSSKSSQYR